MRLIDADELMDVILRSKKINSECTLEENAVDTYDNGQQETFELVIKMVEKQPTAYDPDKVVEQIRDMQAEMEQFGLEDMPSDIIEIVKGGGANA